MKQFGLQVMATAALALSSAAWAQPVFTNYAAPGTMGNSAGEPSIGVNPASGAVMYIASSFDGGASWTTQNITPDDPVQGAGGICTAGTTCGSNRNLLDFNDMSVDSEGRVLMGYADGCVGSCVTGGANTFAAKATLARQTADPRLYAQFD